MSEQKRVVLVLFEYSMDLSYYLLGFFLWNTDEHGATVHVESEVCEFAAWAP